MCVHYTLRALTWRGQYNATARFTFMSSIRIFVRFHDSFSRLSLFLPFASFNFSNSRWKIILRLTKEAMIGEDKGCCNTNYGLNCKNDMGYVVGYLQLHIHKKWRVVVSDQKHQEKINRISMKTKLQI